MKGTLVAGLIALSALAVLLPGDEAVARGSRAGLQFVGKWHVTLDTPLGEIPATVGLQPNGKGKLWIEDGGMLNVVHQTVDTWISWTVELPAVQSPDGNAHTIIGRGTLGDVPGEFSGDLVIVTGVEDAESPVGYETHVGTFKASRGGGKGGIR